jgi:hypothetical protein
MGLTNELPMLVWAGALRAGTGVSGGEAAAI